MRSIPIIIYLIIFAARISSQTIAPTQTDVIIIDNGTSGKADPADRIRYTVTIMNTTNPSGTGVQLNIVPDPRTTFVPGSFRSSPLALPDAYTVTGNVGINVPDGSSDLLANDFDDNIAGLTITTGTFPTTNGGSIMINADGSFMYTPPAGFIGTDTYAYTLHDGNAVPGVTPTDMGLITFTMTNLIWFINNTGGGTGGDGRLTTPYKTLGDFNVNSTAAGDVIFVKSTGTNYTGGIILQNNERLFGEGHTGAANLSGVLPFVLAPNSKTLPNINGSRPVIENASGDGILLASNNTIRGLDLGNSSDNGIEDNGNVGTLTISEVGMNKTGGGFRADAGGTLAVTLGIMQVNGGVNAVYLSGTGGTFTITGNTVFSNQSGDAIYIENSSTVVTFPSSNITALGANQAIELRNNTGAISFASGSITGGSTAEDVIIHQGNANVTYAGTVSSNSGATIKITGRTGGTIDFQGTVTHNAAALGIVIGTAVAGENNSGGTIQFSGMAKNVSSSTANAISMTNNTGATINFINGGLNVDVTNGTGMSITGGGTVTVSGTSNTIDASGSGIAFLNSGSGGNAVIDVNANITSATGRVVDIQSRTGSNVTLSGNLSSSGNGIFVNSNSGGTILFSGASKSLTAGSNNGVSLTTNTGTTINFTNGNLVLNCTSGVGFNATGGGTISVQGTGNKINDVTGPAGTSSGVGLNVNATTISASNLTFQSIASGNASAAADPANGIVLNSTGSSGGLIVTGTGGGTNDGSGGTIQNTTGVGVSLTTTSNISLNYMNIQNSGDDGISGNSVTGLTMNRSNVTNNGNALNEDGVDFGGSGLVTPNPGLFGTVTVTNSAFTGNYYNQFTIRNSSSSVSMTMTGCTITGRAAENNNNDGLFYEALGTSTITGNIQNCTFSANKGDHFQAAATNSGDLNVTFKSNILTGGHSSALGQGITINAALGVAFGGYSGNVVYDVDGNTITGAISNGVSIVQGTSSNAATFDGFVRNNFIGTSGVSLSGSTQANGVYIDSRGNGTHTSSVTGNTLRQCFDRGILLEAGDGNPVAHLTITGNIIDQQVDPNAREAIQTNFGITSTNVFGEIDTPVICLQLGGAGALANTFSHGAGAPDDFRLRKRFEATVRLPGYAGGTGQDATSLAQVVAFIQGQNTGSAGEPGSAAASGTGGGYTGGAACDLP